MPTSDALSSKNVITAAVIVIGDEILSGRTKDKNIGYIADHLTAIGIQLTEVRIVPDREEMIIEALNALRNTYDYVFTTGGIGPTHDDITSDCVAKAFKVPISIDQRAVNMLRLHYEEHDLTEARLRMARIPHGAVLIENIVSRAPGFMMENVIVMAGVPHIMQVMLDDITPKLRTGRKMMSATILVEKPEGDVAPVLSEAQATFPDVSMGSYPFYKKGELGVHVVLRSIDEHRLKEAEAALGVMFRKAGLL